MARNQKRDKAAILKKLAEVRVVEIACKQIGVSRSTYYRWLEDDYQFKLDCELAVQQGTDRISDLAESQVISRIKAGDFRASTYWLEKHHPDYVPRRHNELDKHENPFARFSEDKLLMMMESTDEIMRQRKEQRENDKGKAKG